MFNTASVFAENMGFTAEDLTTNKSISIFTQWLKDNCQPNYRKVVFSTLALVCHYLVWKIMTDQMIYFKDITMFEKVMNKMDFHVMNNALGDV